MHGGRKEHGTVEVGGVGVHGRRWRWAGVCFFGQGNARVSVNFLKQKINGIDHLQLTVQQKQEWVKTYRYIIDKIKDKAKAKTKATIRTPY